MPKKTIQICFDCGLEECDGATWWVAKCVHRDTKEEWTQQLCKDNRFRCTWFWFGQKDWRTVEGVPVGWRVLRQFDNWVPPSIVTLEKVEN